MRWFQALLPREHSFFDRFVAHARMLVPGAQALREVLNGGAGVAAACAAVVQHEEDADEVTREVFLAIRRTFITPFDRSDIRDLITALDDAIDQMQKTAKSITLFEVTEFQPEMRELGDLAIQAAYLTLEATELLRDMRRNAAAPERHRRGRHPDREPLRRGLRRRHEGAVPAAARTARWTSSSAPTSSTTWRR